MAMIELSPRLQEQILRHLFTETVEQVVFGFARPNGDGQQLHLRIDAIDTIPPSGFEFQSDFHIELRHETHARIIKAAFDHGASLVEFHSHRSSRLAEFSPTDLTGFAEFVPHVRWRLGGRPYVAVVHHEGSFDGLVWTGSDPVQLEGIRVGGTVHRPTGRTLAAIRGEYER